MDKDGQIMKELKCMFNLLQPKNKHHVLFVDYHEIVDKPQKTINSIYKFLGIPKYKHRFKNFKQIEVNGIKYNDSIFGKGMHTIKTKSLTNLNYQVRP